MQPFQIFRPGQHTASSGATLSFSEDDLRAAVAAYDPELHEAPIVVGHPKDNHPAYGWVGALAYNEGAIAAEPTQLDPAFAEMVEAGRFKKRSASWYLPDAPGNPKPGTLYLRHVGFLGAQPPAVKGLKDVTFAEAEEGVLEFSESGSWAFTNIADLFRNLREWLIEDKGMDVADRLVPTYSVESITRAAATPEATAVPMYAEKKDPAEMKTVEQLQAELDAAQAENATLKAAGAQAADFAERDSALTAREAAVAAAEAASARTALEARIDATIKAGRLLPAQRANTVAFAAALAADTEVEFAEGDKVVKLSPREHYLRQLEAAPKLVDYSERAGAGDTPPIDAGDPQALAARAREIVQEQSAKGKTISFTEAVALATATTAAD
jgi:hypothetical protein